MDREIVSKSDLRGALSTFLSPSGDRVAIGTSSKIKIYEVKYGQVDIICDYEIGDGGAATLIANYMTSSLFATVPESGTRVTLYMLDQRNEAPETITTFHPHGEILNVFFVWEHLVVVMKEMTIIYPLSKGQQKTAPIVISTAPHSGNAVAAVVNDDVLTVAYPSPGCRTQPVAAHSPPGLFSDHGTITIRRYPDERALHIDIPAHQSPIQVAALDSLGKFVATASQRGTLIRVFSTLSGAYVCTCQRGHTRSLIQSISFHAYGDEKEAASLCVASESGTVRIYHLPTPAGRSRAGTASPSLGSDQRHYRGSRATKTAAAEPLSDITNFNSLLSSTRSRLSQLGKTARTAVTQAVGMPVEDMVTETWKIPVPDAQVDLSAPRAVNKPAPCLRTTISASGELLALTPRGTLNVYNLLDHKTDLNKNYQLQASPDLTT